MEAADKKQRIDAFNAAVKDAIDSASGQSINPEKAQALTNATAKLTEAEFEKVLDFYHTIFSLKGDAEYTWLDSFETAIHDGLPLENHPFAWPEDYDTLETEQQYSPEFRRFRMMLRNLPDLALNDAFLGQGMYEIQEATIGLNFKDYGTLLNFYHELVGRKLDYPYLTMFEDVMVSGIAYNKEHRYDDKNPTKAKKKHGDAVVSF